MRKKGDAKDDGFSVTVRKSDMSDEVLFVCSLLLLFALFVDGCSCTQVQTKVVNIVRKEYRTHTQDKALEKVPLCVLSRLFMCVLRVCRIWRAE